MSRVLDIFRHFQFFRHLCKKQQFLTIFGKGSKQTVKTQDEKHYQNRRRVLFLFPNKNHTKPDIKTHRVLQCFSNNETNHAKAYKSKQIKTHCGFTTFFQQPNQTRQNQTKADKLQPTVVLQRFSKYHTKTDKATQNHVRFCVVLFGFVWFCLVLCCFAWFCLVLSALFGFVCLLPCFLASLFPLLLLLPCFLASVASLLLLLPLLALLV